MNISKLFGFAVVASLLCSAGVRAEVRYADLTDAEKNAVNSGQQVVKQEAVQGSVWPRVTVFQRIEADPQQVAAVMFDYPLHNGMFEGIIKSVPKAEGAAQTEIEYTMTFPKVLGISLPNENYTVNDTLTKLADGYSIAWKMVRADSMKDTNGVSKFEKLGNATLVSYTNFINPPRESLAKLIVKMAVDRVKGSVKDLEKQVLKEIAEDQGRLQAQVMTLENALK